MVNTPATHKCPRCRKETFWAGNPDRPFCSEKCRLIDLSQWADEEFRIPTDEGPMSEDNVIPYPTDEIKES